MHSVDGRRESKRILSAASASFEDSVQALAGSLNVNWPVHPPMLVYDLGMTRDALCRLRDAGIEVRRVPEFCRHWRKHFVWRAWCIRDAPADSYLWLDAGTCCLRPLDDALQAAELQGYFCVTNHWPLLSTTNAELKRLLNLDDAWLARTASVAGGVHGLKKDGAGMDLVNEFYELAFNENVFRATDPLHRHDQPVLTALLHKHFGSILYADHDTYCGWQSPNQVVNQKLWVHRKRMLKHDCEYFAAYVDRPGPPRIPDRLPPPNKPTWLKRLRIRVAELRGRAPTGAIYDGVKD